MNPTTFEGRDTATSGSAFRTTRRNEFVQGFLGPTTSFDGRTYRPHEIELGLAGDRGLLVRITDVVRLGFEVRVVDEDLDGPSSWVQLTHDEARQLDPQIGDTAVVRPRSALLILR